MDNSLIEALELRKSCRKYNTEKEVDQATISLMTWAANRAPYASGGPRREVSFVRDREKRRELAEACFGQPYVAECSVVFIFSGTDTETMLKSGTPKYSHDCDAACAFVDLMAWSRGYQTCWIGHFNREAVQQTIQRFNITPHIILLVGEEA